MSRLANLINSLVEEAALSEASSRGITVTQMPEGSSETVNTDQLFRKVAAIKHRYFDVEHEGKNVKISNERGYLLVNRKALIKAAAADNEKLLANLILSQMAREF